MSLELCCAIGGAVVDWITEFYCTGNSFVHCIKTTYILLNFEEDPENLKCRTSQISRVRCEISHIVKDICSTIQAPVS